MLDPTGCPSPRAQVSRLFPLLHPSELQPLPSEPGPLATRFLHYAGQLKFALPTLPAGGFDPDGSRHGNGAAGSLLPVETLLVELLRICEDTTPRSMAAIQLDKLYLVPQSQQLQRANPLVVAGVIPPRLSPALHFRGCVVCGWRCGPRTFSPVGMRCCVCCSFPWAALSWLAVLEPSADGCSGSPATVLAWSKTSREPRKPVVARRLTGGVAQCPYGRYQPASGR